MRSINGISSSILLFAATRLPSSNVGAFSNTATRGQSAAGGALFATRAIGPGASKTDATAALKQNFASTSRSKVTAVANEKPAAKAKRAAAKAKTAEKKEENDAFASFASKLSAAGSLPKTAKSTSSKAVVQKKPASKKLVTKKPAPKKNVAKKERATKTVVKAKPKQKTLVKAKPKVKVAVKKKLNRFDPTIANKLAKKSNRFDSGIANALVKVPKKKKILTPLMLKQPTKKKPKIAAVNDEVLNPVTFGLKVIQSKGGQEAAGVLISGGLKLVSATLDEGKTAKVSVPRGLNSKTGEIKTESVSVGPKELLDGGIFAGKEALQVAGSVYNKAYRGYSEPRNNSKKTKVKISPAGKGVLNPLTFGLKVVQSKQAQEATGELIDGSLKLLQATLEEGKKSKVSIPRRVDSRTGQVTTKAVSVGPGELFQVGLFAGGEIFEAGKNVYSRLYVTGDDGSGKDAKSVATKSRVSTIAASVDPKTRKTLAPEKETYVVNVGGKKVRVVRNAGGLFN